MREWLSGGVSPCQGEGRGFESRLALFFFKWRSTVLCSLRCFHILYFCGQFQKPVSMRL